MKFSGSFASGASGSMGGITASRNRGGQYIRRRAVPVNPNTARQATVRSIFNDLVQAWNNVLTGVQREAWTLYANNTPRVNSLGSPITLTGQQAFIGANTARVQSGGSVVSAAPIIFNTGESVSGILTINTETPFALGVDGANLSSVATFASPTDAIGALLVYIGRPQNNSRRFYKGPYQLAGSLPTAAAISDTPIDLVIADLLSDYPVVVGENLPIKLVMTYQDGRTSNPFALIVPVVADPS